MPDFISTFSSSPYNPVNLRKRSTRTKAYVALAMVCFFWGTTWLASKQGVKYMPAFQLAGIRQFTGGLVYVIYFIAKGKAVWPSLKEWKIIGVLALFNFILSNGLATWGLKYISGGLAAILNAIVPLWLVVNSFFSRAPALPAKAVIGFSFGFAGICFIFYDHLHDFLNPGFTLGILISLAATWTWAMGTVYTKKHAKTFNPYFGIGLQMVISGIVLYALSQITGMAVPLSRIPWQAWASIGYLVLFGSVVAFLAYLYALQNLSAAQTSLYAYINPIVAMLLGALMFDEKLTWFIAVGGAITLYGVYLVNHAFRKTK
ncbi:MAG: EamA family transporter [Chitinophagaceae bacterium]